MNKYRLLTVTGATQLFHNEVNSDTSEDDAKYLLSYVMQKDFTWLRTWPDEPLTEQQVLLLEQVIQRRQQGEPIAYIIGQVDFWTLTLNTNSSTLIPRSETELLVELGIQFLAERQLQFPAQKVLDLGTGTGAIALAIASERKNDKIVAVDFLKNAVELAQQNAQLNGIRNIEFFQSDWFEGVSESHFDLIVSNPPYIEDGDPHLHQGDLIFEPRSALVANDKGLSAIKIIVNNAICYLNQSGKLMIEHGYQQGEAVRTTMMENGFHDIETVKDLAGLDRVTLGIH